MQTTLRIRRGMALAALLLTATAPLASQAAAAGQKPLQPAQVEALVQRAYERFAPVGVAVAVLQDGVLLAEVAAGRAGGDTPMTPHTLCNIASCSKAFTAAAVLLLVQDGVLNLDDRVVDHVPEFRLADPWITAHMTVRDLLCHRSGLVTFAGDLLWYGSDYDDAEVLRRLERLPIPQRFREQFGYQNLLYMVAGLVVQRRSGSSWEEFVERRLFAPLGMTASRASAPRLPAEAPRARPHIDGQEIPDHPFVACKPAAAIYSSVHELSLWMRALLAGGKVGEQVLLSPASLAEWWRPHVGTGPGTGANPADLRGYGLGWFVSLERGQKLVEHDGGMPGFLSKVSMLPAERFGFAVLNNSNDGVLNEALKRALLTARAGGDGLAVIDDLAQRKQRITAREAAAVQGREAQRQPNTTPGLPLAAYAGRYRDAVYGDAEVVLDGEALQVVLVPSRSRLHGTLQHWHHDTFRVDFPDRFLPFALLRFQLDTAGKVAGFRIDCPIADFDFGALDFQRLPAKP
jgi:CubicO group peptidase (beta-lactamase class C family)